jgi:hypothetical protein
MVEVYKRSLSCGGSTRTNDLWVMSPTSYQLLHSAILWRKGTVNMLQNKFLVRKNDVNAFSCTFLYLWEGEITKFFILLPIIIDSVQYGCFKNA